MFARSCSGPSSLYHKQLVSNYIYLQKQKVFDTHQVISNVRVTFWHDQATRRELRADKNKSTAKYQRKTEQ